MPSDLSAPFPDLDWPDQAIIAVDAGDPAAVITTFTIHLAQDVPEDLLPPPQVPAILGYVPQEQG